MLQTQRQLEILNRLKENPALLTKQLAQELNVSEMTIRRDFNDLVNQGLIIREHGGAMLPNQTINQFTDVLMESKLRVNTESKEAIAKTAVQLVKDGDCVFLDSGSTSLALLPLLTERRITVVTYSDLTLRSIKSFKGELILLGGTYNFNSAMTYGPICLDNLKHFSFDICFCSCISIDLKNGQVFTADTHNGQIKRYALEQSNQKILVADYSKFQQKGFYHCAQLEDFDYLFTDYANEELEQYKERTTIVVVDAKI